MWRTVNKDWKSSGTWRKSTKSRINDCVYVRDSLDAVRDSKNPGGAPLQLGPGALAALVRAVSA